MALKAGTRIEVLGFDLGSNPAWEAAKIGRWHSSLRDPALRPKGYHPVTFEDGGRLLMHEDRIRVISNG